MSSVALTKGYQGSEKQGLAKARARGYRNTRNLINVIYLIAGKLFFEGLPSMG